MNCFQYIVLLGTLLFSTVSMAQKDSVVRDPQTGEWVYTLYNPENTSQQHVWRYVPRNQIVPTIKSVVRANGQDFEYRYRVSNGNKAKQPIAYIWMRGFFQVAKPDASKMPDLSKMPFPEYLDKMKPLRQAERDALARSMSAPKGWHAKWNIDSKDFSEYGWFPDWNDDSNLGVAPKRHLDGMRIRRAELPGVSFAEVQGYSQNPEILGGLPSTGPIADAVKQMEAEDSLWTPALVPAIAIPVPYSAPELARRIKYHVNYWLKLEIVAPDVLDRLNRQFDALIAALERNNKPTALGAIGAIRAEVLGQHKDLSDPKMEDDDDAQDAEPIKLKSVAIRSSAGTVLPTKTIPLHRVAARALVFDLNYLTARL